MLSILRKSVFTKCMFHSVFLNLFFLQHINKYKHYIHWLIHSNDNEHIPNTYYNYYFECAFQANQIKKNRNCGEMEISCNIDIVTNRNILSSFKGFNITFNFNSENENCYNHIPQCLLYKVCSSIIQFYKGHIYTLLI